MRALCRYLLLGVVVAAGLFACNCNPSKTSSAEPTSAASKRTPDQGDGKSFENVDPRESILARAIAHMLESQHVRQMPIDDEVSRKAFDRYLENLDPDKLFLLREDVAALREYAELMDDELRSGRLELAHVANLRFKERLAVVKAIVGGHLGQPFDFSVDESLETDSEKVDYSQTDDELRDVWRKRLKLEILGRVLNMEERAEGLQKAIDSAKTDEDKKLAQSALAKIPTDEVGREAKAREELGKSYDARFVRLADQEPLDAASAFFNAITEVFDPHTSFMAPETKDNFDIQMTGSLEGIGAILSEDAHYIRVMELVPGGASWRQGELEAGDLILAVAQQGEEPIDVGDMRINKVVQMIRGKAGSVVTLTVKKSDDSIKSIAITRDVVAIEAAFARGAILESKTSKQKFGYIYLPSFYGNTRSDNKPDRRSADDVRKLLEIFSQRKVAGVIVDVRGNGGGLLDDARQMTGLFIEKGPVVQTQLPDGTLEVLADEDSSVSFDRPVVVMIDRFSASAAEILAGALQDYDRAIVVGPGPTHGKGTVQALLDLSRVATPVDNLPMGVLKLTVQQFFRVNGASTQWKGVEADIPFPDPTAHIESGERHLKNSIPWTQVAALDHEDWTRPFDIAALRQKSQTRQSQSVAFQKVMQRSNLLKKRSKMTLVPLQRAKFEAEDDAHREALKKLADDDKRPAEFSSEVVNYDGHTPPLRRAGKKDRDPTKVWQEEIARDFMLGEALHIAEDMVRP